MYLRMAITGSDAASHQPQGIFHAGWGLLDGGDLSDAEADDLRSLLQWFNTNMAYPDAAQRRVLSVRAVFWFKPGARDVIKKAWELVQLLRLHGFDVDVLKTDTPGTIVFSDTCQIAAIPIKGTCRR